MIKTVFLDMDDVLNKFTHHILNEKFGFGIDVQNEWPIPGERDIVKVYTILTGESLTYDEFFANLTHDDWGAAEPTDEFDELLDMSYSLVGKDNVAILTAGLMHETCATGKQTWVKRFLPRHLHDKCIVCQHKYMCAGPTKLLIDDADSNVSAFLAAGGKAIQFPQPWNRSRNHTANRMDFIRKVLNVQKISDKHSDRMLDPVAVGNDVF